MSRIRLYDTIIAEMHRSAETEVVSLLLSSKSLYTFIASFYARSKVCHIEAGLRTHNKLSPFPEEINRQITGRICDLHFAPTEASKTNLLAENISKKDILVTGNTVIDALFESVSRVENLRTKNIEHGGRADTIISIITITIIITSFIIKIIINICF